MSSITTSNALMGGLRAGRVAIAQASSSTTSPSDGDDGQQPRVARLQIQDSAGSALGDAMDARDRLGGDRGGAYGELAGHQDGAEDPGPQAGLEQAEPEAEEVRIELFQEGAGVPEHVEGEQDAPGNAEVAVAVPAPSREAALLAHTARAAGSYLLSFAPVGLATAYASANLTSPGASLAVCALPMAAGPLNVAAQKLVAMCGGPTAAPVGNRSANDAMKQDGLPFRHFSRLYVTLDIVRGVLTRPRPDLFQPGQTGGTTVWAGTRAAAGLVAAMLTGHDIASARLEGGGQTRPPAARGQPAAGGRAATVGTFLADCAGTAIALAPSAVLMMATRAMANNPSNGDFRPSPNNNVMLETVLRCAQDVALIGDPRLPMVGWIHRESNSRAVGAAANWVAGAAVHAGTAVAGAATTAGTAAGVVGTGVARAAETVGEVVGSAINQALAAFTPPAAPVGQLVELVELGQGVANQGAAAAGGAAPLAADPIAAQEPDIERGLPPG